MSDYPDFNTQQLKNKLKAIFRRGKINQTRLAAETGVHYTRLSRQFDGYERFTQNKAREILLKACKVLIQKCGATKEEIFELFELARNAPLYFEDVPLEKKERKRNNIYRPLDRENEGLEAEVLDLLEGTD